MSTMSVDTSRSTIKSTISRSTKSTISIPCIPPMPTAIDHSVVNRVMSLQKQSVPSNLIPVQANKITVEWAKNTFRYAHIFVPNINSHAYENDEDSQLVLWKNKAREIQEEIKSLGVTQTMKYICNDMKNRHCTIPNTGANPTNLGDIFSILCDSNFYKSNVNMARERIYRYCWGIYRVGHNDWIHTYVNAWLNEKNLTLDYGTTEKETRKNFVYSNFQKKVSTLFSDRIISRMSRDFGEYLCCRLKKRKNDISSIEIRGMCGKCYLVQSNTKNTTDRKEILKRKLEQLVDETRDEFEPNYVFNELSRIYNEKGVHNGANIDVEMKGEISFIHICNN